MHVPLPVRRLKIDLSQGFDRHWLDGDAYRTQLFNAMSMMFPAGEQYFIDAVREAQPLVTDPALAEDIRGFIGQEATHRHMHEQFNAVLAQQGLRNVVERIIDWRIRHTRWMSTRTKLSTVMAYEHFTAIFGDGLLGPANWLAGTQGELRVLWTWHAMEETEHKAVAFDCYRALGGGYIGRIGWYLYVTLIFNIDAIIQTTLNQYSDGTLFKWRSLGQLLRFQFGKGGVVRHMLPQWLAYLRPGFHPWQQDNMALGKEWLAQNSAAFYPAAAETRSS